MKILEIIELRSGGKDTNTVEHQMTELVDELNQGLQDYTIKLYVNANVENDFSVHIHQKSNGYNNHGSTVGLRLHSILKEYGLVNQSIWTELSIR